MFARLDVGMGAVRTALALSTLLALAGCSAGPDTEDGDGPPAFAGGLPGNAPGATPAPGNTPAPGPNATGSAPPSQAASGEQNPASNAPIASGSAPAGNSAAGNGSAGNGSAGNGAGGSAATDPAGAAGNGGAGGASMVGGGSDVGAGGSTMGVAGSIGMQPEPAPATPPPAQEPAEPAQPPPAPAEPTPPPPPPPPPAAPAGPDIPCPADATFCSGFEGADLPAGTNFVIGGDSSFSPQFTLDTTEARSGTQSFAIPGASPGFSYRALTIPAPGQDFWARLYVRVDSAFGDGNHDSLFGASNAGPTNDNNNETVIELSEQFGYVLLNTDDCTLQCNTPDPQLQLAANEWHCMEAHYDANAGHVEIFLEGDRFIDSVSPEYNLTFQTFRIGYMRFNTERTVRYDDVVVARSRVGCD